tara:strand:- start:1863 stop:2468 length:606 start_codon:yes stop_codon:yes gene_type:complete
MAVRFSASPVANEEIYEEKLRVSRKYFTHHTKVLEFGCGTGGTAIAHSPYVQSIVAVDFSKNMLDIAREKSDLAKVKNIEFVESGIEDLDVKDSSFDAVLGLGILHLLQSEQSVIDKVYRILQPGGVFISSTPCLSNASLLFKLRRLIAYWFGFGPLIRFYSSRCLESAILKSGFQIVHKWEPGSDPLKSIFLIARKEDTN